MRHPLHKRALYQVARALHGILFLAIMIIVGRFIYGGLTQFNISAGISRTVSVIVVMFILFSSKRVQSLVVDSEKAIKNAILKQ